MTARHTPDHDVWAPDGRCDVLITEPDGTLTRCGYLHATPAFDLTPDPPPPEEPRGQRVAKHVIIGTIMGVLGIAIALDWLAFVLFVSRNEADPQLAVAFIMRVAVSGGYAAACVWLWRRI